MNNSIGLIESKGLITLIEAADVILKNSPIEIIGVKKLDNGIVSLFVSGDSEYVKSAVESAVDAGKRVGEIYAHSVIDNPGSELLELLSELFTLKEKQISIQKTERSESGLELSDREIINKKNNIISNKTNIKAPVDDLIKKVDSEGTKNFKDQVAIDIKEKNNPESKIIVEQSVASVKSLSTIERLRKEALGLSKKETKSEMIDSTKRIKGNKNIELNYSKINFSLVKEMNVHKLRHYAREFENFPIKGRQISRATRDELVDLFKRLN